MIHHFFFFVGQTESWVWTFRGRGQREANGDDRSPCRKTYRLTQVQTWSLTWLRNVLEFPYDEVHLTCRDCRVSPLLNLYDHPISPPYYIVGVGQRVKVTI